MIYSRRIIQLMLAVRSSFKEPLRDKTLFEWHELVLQDPHQKPHSDIGTWRTDPSPMQIVSGALGKEIVFFEAPPSHHIPFEMKRFMRWFNATSPSSSTVNHNHLKGLVRSAVAHLYFESIHPFSDGNGRIGRAIAEKALSQDLGQPVCLSLSKILYQKRKAYYDAPKVYNDCELFKGDSDP